MIAYARNKKLWNRLQTIDNFLEWKLVQPLTTI